MWPWLVAVAPAGMGERVVVQAVRVRAAAASGMRRDAGMAGRLRVDCSGVEIRSGAEKAARQLSGVRSRRFFGDVLRMRYEMGGKVHRKI
jgi:hypothetical protein